jgi:DNA polymerase
MHPETEIQSVAVKVNGDPAFVIFGEENIKAWADATDFSNAMLVGHNMSGFDAMICAWRFNIKPKAWACTLAMARNMGYVKTVGGSLKKVAADLGIGEKLSLEATNTKGKKLADFSDEEIAAMEKYNVVDTELCAGIFKALAPQVGVRELKLIDLTIKMLVEPQFDLDIPLLKSTLTEIVEQQKKVLLAVAEEVSEEPLGLLSQDERIEAAKKTLASAPKFAKYLKSRGVEVPQKQSPSNPEKLIPALAKTDEAFLALQEHENFDVAAAASARLNVKSTILESRIGQFIACGEAIGGKLPIALNYYGADTTGRWSGTMKMNQQNLPRVNPYKPQPSDSLRKSLVAPEGYKVVVADLSGIELRVNHFLWLEPQSTALFKEDPEKADLYKDFASRLYDIPINEVTKEQRQVGKVAHLGLGFGAGAATFQKVAKLMGGVDLSLEESQDVVYKWRDAYSNIAQGWKTCHYALTKINQGMEFEIDPWGLCYTTHEGIKTPMGMIRYPHLRKELNEEDGREEWVYGEGRRKARIYAGKVTENIVQHLAREVICDNMLAVAKTPLGKKYKPALTVHDELVYVVRDEEAQEMLDTVQEIMRNGVTWWSDLVTWSEGDIAQTYGDAK